MARVEHFEEYDYTTDDLEQAEEKTQSFHTTCQRKVKLGRKVKLCNDPVGEAICGWCSNHCQDAHCPTHGHYTSPQIRRW